MKRIILLICVFGCFFGQAQQPPEAYFHYVSLADSLQRADNFREAAALYNSAFASFKGRGFVNDRYKAACAYARIGNSDSAFYNLFRIANKGGWGEHEFLVSDSDLVVLHTDARWNKLVNKVRENKAAMESHLNKPLAEELEKIFEDDQKYRLLLDSAEKTAEKNSPQIDSLQKIIKAQDEKNLKRVSELLDQYGWLGIDDVGRKGNQALFLVIEHSDLETRKKYLPVMQDGKERNKAAPSEVALLEDGILIDQGLGQRYGSQVRFNEQTRKYEPYPIEDEPNVNERRREMGLGPLEDYLRQWGIYYSLKK